ncbi:TadE/TadG family type IV pilus assembly protein [Demequina lignilytica]|uniref:TadE/TadG family type IV pilus assembly protein n=1 Tax=Demequina lignilytica TaxID=3051663 RepID=A0AB35MGY1_9MICO|nr:TadE/TadG family type IV pilus assembly protein [Demequina sp. SYSU T0a273]MDN4483026.1 TadE/TadG family type IV pilus assembly protein [Demequina sp. SYSU T0a273]
MDDRGGVLVEHLFAILLVVAVGLGLIQVAVAVHTRNTLTACAAEAARIAARDDAVEDARSRAQSCARDSVGVAAEVRIEAADAGGLEAVRVTVEGRAPVLGIWRAGTVTATARALDEAALGAP